MNLAKMRHIFEREKYHRKTCADQVEGMSSSAQAVDTKITPFLRCWKKATNPSQVMGRVQRAWGAFAEVTTGLGCAFVYFWSPEARAAWPAELSPRCYGRARGERAGASFQ